MGKIAKTGNQVVDRIKETANQKGISLKYLCEKIGRGKTYFSDVVNGSGEIPNDRLKTIADILGTSTQYLITGEENKKTPTKDGERIYRIPDEETLKLLELLESRDDIRYLAAASQRATPEHVRATAKMFDELYGRDKDQ